MVKTLCRDCVFAEWDKDNQTGCSVGRLDKYKELECAFDCEEDEGDKAGSVVAVLEEVTLRSE